MNTRVFILLIFLTACGTRPAVQNESPIESKLASSTEPQHLFIERATGDQLTTIVSLPFGAIDEPKEQRGLAEAWLGALQVDGSLLADRLAANGCYMDRWVEPFFSAISIHGNGKAVLSCLESVASAIKAQPAQMIRRHGNTRADTQVHLLGPALNAAYDGQSLGQVVTANRTETVGADELSLRSDRHRIDAATVVAVGAGKYKTEFWERLEKHYRTSRTVELKHRPMTSSRADQTLRIEVSRVAAKHVEFALAVPLTVSTVEHAARADLIATILETRLATQLTARDARCQAVRAFIYSPAEDSRLLLTAKCEPDALDGFWDSAIDTFVSGASVPVTPIERARAMQKYASDVQMTTHTPLATARLMTAFGTRWSGNGRISHGRWQSALQQPSHKYDSTIFKRIASLKGATANVLIPKTRSKASSSLLAERLYERAQEQLNLSPKGLPIGARRIGPRLTTYINETNDEGALVIHLELAGGRLSERSQYRGAATIAAALLSIQLPNIEIRLQAHELLLSVETSQNNLATTLAAIEDAIQPKSVWPSELFETARRRALATLQHQLGQEQIRFHHEMARVVHRRLGYPSPGLEQLQKMIIHMTHGRARAWFERYVSDTSKTLVLTGHLAGAQAQAVVKRVLSRSASKRVDTPVEKKTGARWRQAAETTILATQVPRYAAVYSLEKPNRLERETLRLLATALKERFEGLEWSDAREDIRVDVRTNDTAKYSFLSVVVIHEKKQRARVQKRLADVIRTLKSIPIPFDEFRRIRQNTVGPAGIELTAPKALNRWFGVQLKLQDGFVGRRATQTWRTVIEGVSPLDLKRVANKIFGSPKDRLEINGVAAGTTE